jgi:hypothetical protein
VARVAAPYDRAAKQALQIADYMYSSADTGPSAGSQLNLETKAAAVNRSGDVNFGRSAGVAKSTVCAVISPGTNINLYYRRRPGLYTSRIWR